jgi:hypothetical protein
MNEHASYYSGSRVKMKSCGDRNFSITRHFIVEDRRITLSLTSQADLFSAAAAHSRRGFGIGRMLTGAAIVLAVSDIAKVFSITAMCWAST